MNDLEMTKLCAKAMRIDMPMYAYAEDYDPLHDDAQAMALVNRFKLSLSCYDNRWAAYEPDSARPESEEVFYSYADDPNRAIVECVAKMQKAKNERA